MKFLLSRTMKRAFRVFLLIQFTSTCYSQDSAMQIAPGVPGMIKAQRSFVFIDVTHNLWLNSPDEITTEFLSGGFNFNIFYEIPVVKNVVGLAPGIGFSNTSVKNNSFFFYYYDHQHHVDSTALIPFADTVIVKSKLSVSYLDIPVEIRFRIKPDERGKNIWIAPGFRAGVPVSSFWKYKSDDAFGNTTKLKYYGIENIESFRYGVSLRAGYYKFGAYAFYSLNKLFEKHKGPELTPVSIGITFTPF